MVRNYLTTALRNFMRHPIYSAINVSGLVLGLACSIFIFLWVLDEMDYDRYHKDNDRVFKVMWNHNFSDGSILTEEWTSGLLAGALREEIPEVERATRLAWSELRLFKYGEAAHYEGGDYADKDIFEVLNLPLAEGNVHDALPDNNSVAISRRLAEKFFKGESALGKVFQVDNSLDLKVTAVFENTPDNATEQFEFILPFEIYIRKEQPDISKWDGSGWQKTLLKLKDKGAQRQVDEKLKPIVKRFEEASLPTPPPPFIFPMAKWRLYSNFENGLPAGGRISYVISFSLVAMFILMIACINFMNLSTARSANRSREVGIRKVAGASRGSLIRQFLTESIVLSLVSLGIALLIVGLFLPLFNSFTEKQLSLNLLNPVITASLVGISLLTGLVAGSYPAFFLSSFRPASVLKGKLQAVVGGTDLRKALVVFQFGLSVIIIVCALVIFDQIAFLRNKDLGFDKNNVLSINSNEQVFKTYETFRNELLQSSVIKSVGMGAAHPMEIDGQAYYDWDGKLPGNDIYFNQANCDYDYLETLGFTFVAGRNFSEDFPSDSAALIITEGVIDHLGTSNPIGLRLRLNGKEGRIIGVIRDFNNLSIQRPLQPTVFTLGRTQEELGRWAGVFVRYEPGRLPDALSFIRSTFKKNSPDFPIQFRLIDENFEDQLKTESMVATLSSCFTVIAIFISCLGLFGLASFSAERRAKEIGVRKVLGASVTGLVVLLCRDFTKLIIYAIVLGSPLAWYLMDQFLSAYPYRTEMNLSTFVIPALVMLLISLGIISYQSMKAAFGNPVEALRNE